MQRLADELGVSRATVFRRAGGREELLSKALWLLTERTLATASTRWEAANWSMIDETQPFWRLHGSQESRKLDAGQEYIGKKCPATQPGNSIIH